MERKFTKKKSLQIQMNLAMEKLSAGSLNSDAKKKLKFLSI